MEEIGDRFGLNIALQHGIVRIKSLRIGLRGHFHELHPLSTSWAETKWKMSHCGQKYKCEKCDAHFLLSELHWHSSLSGPFFLFLRYTCMYAPQCSSGQSFQLQRALLWRAKRRILSSKFNELQKFKFKNWWVHTRRVQGRKLESCLSAAVPSRLGFQIFFFARFVRVGSYSFLRGLRALTK